MVPDFCRRADPTMRDLEPRFPRCELDLRAPDGPDKDQTHLWSRDAGAAQVPQESGLDDGRARLLEHLPAKGLLPRLAPFRPAAGQAPVLPVRANQDDPAVAGYAHTNGPVWRATGGR